MAHRSLDDAMLSVLAEVENISSFKEELRTTLKALALYSWLPKVRL